MTIPKPAAIEEIVRAAVSAYDSPALSVAIAVEGKVVFSAGYGMQNVGEKLSANAETIYSIASVSKQFTAAGIMRLVERGKISLDDHPSRHLSWARYPEAVTLRHCLAHTSGIQCYSSLPNFYYLPYTEATPEQIINYVGPDLAFQPGDDWQYSNTAYVMLGALIERVSGEPYHEFLSREFFGPLGLERTGGTSLGTILSNAAMPYSRFSLGPLERARSWHPDWPFATGSLYSSVLDLVRWNVALRDGRVVSAESYTAMKTSARLRDGTPADYGFGLFVTEIGGIKEVRHAGGLPGFSTYNVTYPDLGVDIVVFANIDGFDTYFPVVRPIMTHLTGIDEFSAVRLPTGSNVPVLDQKRVAGWIRAAIDGTLVDDATGDGLRTFCTARRLKAFRDLSRFGSLKDVVGSERMQRGSITFHRYRAEFEARPLEVLLEVRDGVQLEEILFRPWHRAA